MCVITHSIRHPLRSEIIRVTPLGDLHLGAALCDEKLLCETVASIEADPLHYYWGGRQQRMGRWVDRAGWVLLNENLTFCVVIKYKKIRYIFRRIAP